MSRRMSASDTSCAPNVPRPSPSRRTREPVGDALHLGQAVRDVDDGGARRADVGDALEQPLALGGGQRFGRLVEDEHLGVQRERARDLQQLVLGHAQLADPGAGVDVGRRRPPVGRGSRPRHRTSAGGGPGGIDRTRFSVTVRSSRTDGC